MSYECFTWFIEIAFGFCLFANALLFVPQALKIYKTKSAKNLSLATFAGFNVVQVVTALHGYILKDWVLTYGSLFVLASCGTVTLLIVLYEK
ncbi:MAG: hypothetical protein LBT67_02180 [Holosporaceae bacterium]|nr:hypothetical protein [Holosporaceae bacterium]